MPAKKKAATQDKAAAQARMAKAREVVAEKRELRKKIEPYLEALAAGVTKKPAGRRTVDWMQGRLEAIEGELGDPNLKPLGKVALLQEKLDLVRDLSARLANAQAPLAEMEADFVEAMPRYSFLTGTSRQAWRMLGVSGKVLNACYASSNGSQPSASADAEDQGDEEGTV